MKRALLVGIDKYQGMNLTGCVADATAVEQLLARNEDGSANWTTNLITSDTHHITRVALRKAVFELFENAPGYDLLFFFAGHGTRTPWGAELVTQDFTKFSLGLSMHDLIALANESPARSVTILLDCCFSGDTGSIPGIQPGAVADNFRLSHAVLRQDVTVMAASRGTETSRESGGHGAFTRVLLDGLGGGATDHLGHVTAMSLYPFISRSFTAWEQRPVLKAHVTEPVVLRIGPPWLDADLLRRLPAHFPTADHHLRLSPAHEGDGRPLPPDEPGTPEQQQFDYLGRLRNAGLVAADDGRDHYWVAMDSGTVALTQLGRYFWHLAQRGVL